MKTALFSILIIIVALLCVVASEGTMLSWLGNAPMDVTGNLFWYGQFPIQLVLVAIVVLVLGKVFKHKPGALSGLFYISYSGFYAFVLTQQNNPLSDVFGYIIAISLACAIWFGIFFWRLDNESTHGGW